MINKTTNELPTDQSVLKEGLTMRKKQIRKIDQFKNKLYTTNKDEILELMDQSFVDDLKDFFTIGSKNGSLQVDHIVFNWYDLAKYNLETLQKFDGYFYEIGRNIIGRMSLDSYFTDQEKILYDQIQTQLEYLENPVKDYWK